jgi:hypothetical protein
MTRTWTWGKQSCRIRNENNDVGQDEREGRHGAAELVS